MRAVRPKEWMLRLCWSTHNHCSPTPHRISTTSCGRLTSRLPRGSASHLPWTAHRLSRGTRKLLPVQWTPWGPAADRFAALSRWKVPPCSARTRILGRLQRATCNLHLIITTSSFAQGTRGDRNYLPVRPTMTPSSRKSPLTPRERAPTCSPLDCPARPPLQLETKVANARHAGEGLGLPMIPAGARNGEPVASAILPSPVAETVRLPARTRRLADPLRRESAFSSHSPAGCS